eukprot:gene18072-24495_t
MFLWYNAVINAVTGSPGFLFWMLKKTHDFGLGVTVKGDLKYGHARMSICTPSLPCPRDSGDRCVD